MTLFTILTVAYNSESFLKATIDSVLAQDYESWQLVVGDDASTDKTWDIISGYNDPRIVSYRNPKNIGEYANRRKSIEKAQGRYCIFIDGDDVIYSHALSTYLAYVTAFPEAAMFFSREWDPRILCPLKLDPVTIYQFEFLDRGIIGGNFSNVLFKTEVLKQYPFPENVRSGDSYIQLTIARNHPAVVVPSGLTWWRRRTNNATEQLFADNRYLSEAMTLRMALLGPGCPLPPEEVETALFNLYGIYLRSLFRLLIKGKWTDLNYLVRNVKVPARYRFSFLTPSKFDYHMGVFGDKPLHTSVLFKQPSTDPVI